MKLKGKTAVITGANSGIGLATAHEFYAQGAKVFITGRKSAAIKEAAESIGKEVVAIRADQSDLGDTDELVQTVKEQAGQVDVLFINAGVAKFLPIDAIDEKTFDEMMDINFKGAFFTLQKFLPILKDGASVIFLSSISSTVAMQGSSVYSASKAALSILAKVAANELAHRKIRVNIVSPGPINTPIFEKMGLPEEQLTAFASSIQEKIPLKKFGEAQDIGKLVSFLASEESTFITGSDYIIDGGLILN